MSNEIPHYLRLHVEEAPQADRPSGEAPHGLAAFCRSFEQATGWRLTLDRATCEAEAGDQEELVVTPQPALAPRSSEDAREGGGALPPPIELYRARNLAKTFVDLMRDLKTTRTELWRREAELAAGVPVTVRDDEQQHLAYRLESVLKGGAEAVGCQAAALYLLDDATTQLKMRAAWGLPRQRLVRPARPLRGAVADLEALVGHAVVIEDTSLLPHWRVPEDFPCAICVPVSSPTEPLGTLWIFCDQVRSFGEEQTNLIEIIAGRIASELQREVLLQECVLSKQIDRQLARASQWQSDRLPNVKPLLDDWQLAGGTESSQLLGRGFYDWFIPPDGSLTLALGCGEGSMLESAFTASSLQSLLRAHGEYPHAAEEMLARVNETFWNTSAGGQFASLLFASIDPETGKLDCSVSGTIQAHLVRPENTIALPRHPHALGTEAQIRPPFWRGEIRPGDVLVVVSPGPQPVHQPAATDACYLPAIERHRDKSAEELVAAVRASLITNPVNGSRSDWAVLIAKRV